MPSASVLEQKKQIVASVADRINNSCAGVIVDYKGISVADDTALRKELREAGVEYTALPMPYVNGISQTSSFVNTWVIPATAKNPELSWRVVEFLSGKEVQQIALDMNFGLPASTLVDTTALEAKTPFNKYFVQALETAVPYPTNINGSEFQNLFQKECESLWAGLITPEEFARRVDEQAKPILSK